MKKIIIKSSVAMPSLKLLNKLCLAQQGQTIAYFQERNFLVQWRGPRTSIPF